MTQEPVDHPPTGPDDGLGLREVLGLGSLLVGAVVAGTALGWLLDELLGTSPALSLIGVAVGIAGGVTGAWLRVKRYLS
jgi:F0F1-type ATP synthase assembly protein I